MKIYSVQPSLIFQKKLNKNQNIQTSNPNDNRSYKYNISAPKSLNKISFWEIK